jgi:hypothetical protein
MKSFRFVACLLAGPVFAQTDLTEVYGLDTHPKVLEILQAAASECATQTDGGSLEIDENLGIVYTDLDGDLQEVDYLPDDAVVDFNYIFCSRGNLWAGSGGAPIHFVLDGTTSQSWTGAGWEVERFGSLPAVILIGRHGSACEGYGAQPCVQALVASEGVLMTVRRPEANEE